MYHIVPNKMGVVFSFDKQCSFLTDSKCISSFLIIRPVSVSYVFSWDLDIIILW